MSAVEQIHFERKQSWNGLCCKTMLVQLADTGCGVFRARLAGLSEVEVPFFFTLSSSVWMAWNKRHAPGVPATIWCR